MPTTLVGLVIFAALLLPGFVYVLAAERNRHADTTVSPFRETATIATTSLGTLGLTLLLFAALRILAPGVTPNVGALVSGPHQYFEAHYARVLTWAGAVLAFACALAYLLAAHRVAPRLADRLPATSIGALVLPARQVQPVSAWWSMFEAEPDCYKYVRCLLDDGSRVAGWLFTFSNDAIDSPDRDLVLSNPYEVTFPDGTTSRETNGVIILSARNIKHLQLTHVLDGPTEADDGDDHELPGRAAAADRPAGQPGAMSTKRE